MAVVIALLLPTEAAPPAATRPAVEVLAWWRFEDVPTGQWLRARLGRREDYSVTADASGRRHDLRTFNTTPTLYPPDTSPTFNGDVATAAVAGAANRASVRFTGKQYLYTVDADADAPLYERTAGSSGTPFTIEGMFRTSIEPGEYTGRPQVMLCKTAAPVAEPTTLAAADLVPATTRAVTTTRSTTRPTTTRATRPAFEGPTELMNDHPTQPLVCFVAGEHAWPAPAPADANHFAVAVVDARHRRHTVQSLRPIVARRWYAFAVVYDGRRFTLWLRDVETAADYQPQAEGELPGGLFPCRGGWTLGCGLIDDVRDNWYQGRLDEVRLTRGVLPPEQFVAAGERAAPRPTTARADGVGPPLVSVVHGLADPDVLLDHGTYYLYGTRDQLGFPVYTSTDLQHWDRGPDVYHRSPGMWSQSRFWAPAVIAYRGRFYLFYSSLGAVADAGGRWSHRACVAVSDSPEGPFVPHTAPLPLTGKAVIDPAPFVDRDGRAYLYFVNDMSENEISQVFVARLNDDLTGIVGEPVLCAQPSQAWEGKLWNEGPNVIRVPAERTAGAGDVYVMTYSAEFWHSPEYGVGFATSRSPLGPWTKNPDNPILQRYRGLFGSGGDCVVPTPDGTGYAIVFHADGPAGSRRRDTYVDRLSVTPDPRLGVMLKPEPWGE